MKVKCYVFHEKIENSIINAFLIYNYKYWIMFESKIVVGSVIVNISNNDNIDGCKNHFFLISKGAK
jgi:hypothetical protein